MIKIIIKKNGTTGWVTLPLKKDILNSIDPNQFLNGSEMVSFAMHEIELNYNRIWRELKDCTPHDLYADRLNANLVSLIRWINDSFGLLVHQNPNCNAHSVMRGMWCKIHNHKGTLSDPKTELPATRVFSQVLELS